VLRSVLAAGCGQFPTGPTTIGHFVRTKEKYFLCDLFGVEKIVTKKCRTIVFYLFYFIAHANHRELQMEGTPTNQLIVSLRADGPHRDAVSIAAATLDMQQRVERAGEVLFLKTYGDLQRTVVIFGSTEGASYLQSQRALPSPLPFWPCPMSTRLASV
jgi:hypothetical protein